MKVENLKIGRTYYMPVKHNPTSYTYGELIAITSDRKAVLINKKGEQLTVSPNKLHTRADKAVRGRKAQERVRRELNIKSSKPTIDYDKLCKSFDAFMSRVDKAELEDGFKRDLLNKMLQSVNLRIDRLSESLPNQ